MGLMGTLCVGSAEKRAGVHPRHRWAAGPLVPLVGGHAGRPGRSSRAAGRGHKGGASPRYPLPSSPPPPSPGPPTLSDLVDLRDAGFPAEADGIDNDPALLRTSSLALFPLPQQRIAGDRR